VHEHARVVGHGVRREQRLPDGPQLRRRLLRALELRRHLLLDELELLHLEPVLHRLVVVVEVLPQLRRLERRGVLLEHGLPVGAFVLGRLLRCAGLRHDDVQLARQLLHDGAELRVDLELGHEVLLGVEGLVWVRLYGQP